MVCKLLGKSRSELFGYFAGEFVDRNQILEKIPWYKRAEKEGIVEFPNEFLLPTPRRISGISKIYFTGYSEDGKLRPQFLHVVQDTTKIRQMEEELEKKRTLVAELEKEVSLLKKVFDAAPVHLGVIDVVNDDTAVKYVYVNPAVASFLRLDSSEAPGQVSVDFRDQPFVKQWIDQIKRSAIVHGPVHFEIISPEATIYSCIGIHIEGNRYGFLSIDITELKKMTIELKQHKEDLEHLVKARTSQLEEALQVKGRFLSVMSHEMRTPLTGMSAALNLLSESKMNQEQGELTKIASVCGDQLLVMINEVLDLTKMEENKMTVEMLPMDVLKVIEDSLDVIALEAERKNIELVLDVQPDMPRFAIGDSIRFRQVLVNLLTNSIKFTETGRVSVKASSFMLEDNQFQLCISVQDSGIGIHDDAKQQIFTPFTQGDNSITRKYGGTGLGLAISKRLVGLMRGTISFESELGKGTTFYVSLKTSRCENDANMIEKLNYSQNKRILIVGFTESLRSSLEKTFQAFGFSTFSSSAQQAMEDSRAYDVAIINISASIKPLEVHQQLIDKLCQYGTKIITTGTKIKDSRVTYLKHPLKVSTITSAIQSFFKEQIPKEERKKPNKGSSILILVVEDNIVNRSVIIKLLQSLGYTQIHAVCNGLEAVNNATKFQYDVILMDVMMPVMGGIEATQIIREKLPPHLQPVIYALTANAFSEDKQRCLQAGMNATITKPINTNELLSFLTKCHN